VRASVSVWWRLCVCIYILYSRISRHRHLPSRRRYINRTTGYRKCVYICVCVCVIFNPSIRSSSSQHLRRRIIGRSCLFPYIRFIIIIIIIIWACVCVCTNTHNAHIIPRCRVVSYIYMCVCVSELRSFDWKLSGFDERSTETRVVALVPRDNNVTKNVPRSIVNRLPIPRVPRVCVYACEIRVIGDGTQLGKSTHYDSYYIIRLYTSESWKNNISYRVSGTLVVYCLT